MISNNISFNLTEVYIIFMTYESLHAIFDTDLIIIKKNKTLPHVLTTNI